jgi:sulfate adenylyltransferase subunit 2
MSKDADLNYLEAESIYIIREAFNKVKPLAMLWSLGKDSNVMLWLVKKAFFGSVPFKLILLDTKNELDEVYAFRDKYVQEWSLPYINAICPPIEETDPSLPPKARAAARKALGLKKVIEEHHLRGVFVGIRRDEQSIRGKERCFSPRSNFGNWDFRAQPPEFWSYYNTELPSPDCHLRIHPLLSWAEIDIWRYIQRENIPVVSLYFSKNGKRYRSLGEKDITLPVDSNASTLNEIIHELMDTTQSERAGRTMDHEEEDSFERLRVMGYM